MKYIIQKIDMRFLGWVVMALVIGGFVSCNKNDDGLSDDLTNLDNPFTNDGEIPAIDNKKDEESDNNEKDLDEIIKSISDLKDMYDGSAVSLNREDDKKVLKVSGTIISDPVSGNQPDGVLIIQSGTLGLCIELNTVSDIISYKKEDSISVALGNATLTKENGNIIVQGVHAASDITVEGRGQEVAPKMITLKELQDHFDDYRSTLVSIEDVHIDPTPDYGEKYAGSYPLDDGTGTSGDIALHAESGSTIGGEDIPYSSVGDINYTFTGIPLGGTGEDYQLWPRTKSDIISYLPVNTPIIITGLLVNPAGADEPEPNHESWDWHHPDNAGFEYIQLMALEDIDFSQQNYSVVVCNNGKVGPDGWAQGYQTSSSFTYKFNLTSGKADKGTFFYVGADSKVIDGYEKGDGVTWQSGYSTDISHANWIRTININDGSTGDNPPKQTGDGFGLATAGLMQNANKKGNSDGVAVFEGTNITGSSIPLDAIFFNPGPDNSGVPNPPVGTALDGSNGYQIPNSDIYSRKNPETGADQHLFGEGTNVKLLPNSATASDTWATLGGVITDKGWKEPRSFGSKGLTNSSQLSELETGGGVTKYEK